ncbi:hypothetical protein BCF11_2131 [Collimonas sp. PA-H2]|uniref:hypothetical protein n=1 Tax=Collimonas sp. PA-H2 TaxID=1881062 RepID=UPI000BF5EE14|nr:hypothetical protein [Collimonas sp. PA-H2]PFH09729.1 hypothetical protein BCF11_2131 [Collimonas sp. PA-H2]
MTIIKSNEISVLSESEYQEEKVLLLASAKCLQSYVDQYTDRTQPFEVLAALATITINRLKRGESYTNITALNIFAQMNILLPEGKSPGSRLSPMWKKLMEEMLPTREKGIQDFARNQGQKFYLWPEKNKSNGGLPSQYYLRICTIPESEISDVQSEEIEHVVYIRELTPEPSWWAKPLLRNGYRLEGWRKWLFLSYGVVSIIFCAVPILFLWILLWEMPNWSIKNLSTSLISSSFFIFVIWVSLRPFFRLLEWRIVMAPTSLVAFREIDVQMEIVRDRRFGFNNLGTIRLVRYAATCPQCKAKMAVIDGHKEFPNRLIGRCRENPGEHVYSFDRFTCKGQKLR